MSKRSLELTEAAQKLANPVEATTLGTPCKGQDGSQPIEYKEKTMTNAMSKPQINTNIARIAKLPYLMSEL